MNMNSFEYYLPKVEIKEMLKLMAETFLINQ